MQGARAGLFRYRISGATGVSSVTIGQRIESLNAAPLAESVAMLSVDIANTLLTAVTWAAYSANAADSWTARTLIATGIFTVSSTITRCSAAITLPQAASNGIEIVFSVGAQTSGTWTIGDAQLEPGSVATPFERRPIGMERALCQRYFIVGVTPAALNPLGTTANISVPVSLPTVMRTTPVASALGVTLSFSNPSSLTFLGNVAGGSWTGNAAFQASAEL